MAANRSSASHGLVSHATALLGQASPALGSRAVRKMIGRWLLAAVNVCASS